mmetsp:Transcript_18339/g.38490  ORF Transcript_18339/g.38490 Transcript_18339/m.38490 type:complete len:103 (+) Transcript_18339:1185-1493(+)
MMGSFTLAEGGNEPMPRPTEVKDRRRSFVFFFLRDARKRREDAVRTTSVPPIAGRCCSICMISFYAALEVICRVTQSKGRRGSNLNNINIDQQHDHLKIKAL